MIRLDGLSRLVGVLQARGYQVVGPKLREGAILYDELASADELPAGWTEIHDPGSYRVERRDDEARFGFTVGPHSWKQFLLPSRVRLWRARLNGGAPEIEEEPPPEKPFAFFGVRSCDLARDRDPGPGPHRRTLRRSRLRGAARGDLRRRRRLRRARPALLLRLDGHRTVG